MTCSSCESVTVAYQDPAEALGHDWLPSAPLCRRCIVLETDEHREQAPDTSEL